MAGSTIASNMNCPAVRSVATSSVVTTLICSRATPGTRSRWRISSATSPTQSAVVAARVTILRCASLRGPVHVASLTSVFRQTRARYLWAGAVDPEIKAARQSEFTMGLERELGRGCSLEAYTHKNVDRLLKHRHSTASGSEAYIIVHPAFALDG